MDLYPPITAVFLEYFLQSLSPPERALAAVCAKTRRCCSDAHCASRPWATLKFALLAFRIDTLTHGTFRSPSTFPYRTPFGHPSPSPPRPSPRVDYARRHSLARTHVAAQSELRLLFLAVLLLLLLLCRSVRRGQSVAPPRPH